MEAVQIESSITLSRVAGKDAVKTAYNGAVAIPFGSFVEPFGEDAALIYGGFIVDKCNGTRDWTKGTTATAVSYETAGFDIWEDTTPYMVRFTVTTLATGGIIASAATVAEDWSESTYIYILMKSSVAFATAGHCTFNIAEDALIGTPQAIDLPIMLADTWYYHRVAIVGATTTRNAVLSYGFKNVTGGAFSGVIDVQYIGRGVNPYGALGICDSDQISIHDNTPSEEYQSGDDMLIIGAGRINAKLIKGATSVDGQTLYVVPGCGSLGTVKILDGNRTITALEVGTTGARIEVRL